MSRIKKPTSLATLINWRLQQIGLLLALGVIRIIPLKIIFLTGKALGSLAYKLTRRYRAIVKRNLRIALYQDDASFKKIDQLSLEVFQLTGANLFSALKTATLSESALKKIITVENIELVEEAVAKNNGIILLLSHMGNWELLAQLGFLLPEGAHPGTHYRPLSNPYINKIIEAQRHSKGTQLFAKRSSTHTITTFLKNNGVLGILADQRAGRKSECVSYFGRLTGFTPMPTLLAKRSGASTLALAVTTTGTAQWTLRFIEHPGEPSPTNTAKALEETARENIADVFWFQDRWRVSRKTPFLLDIGETTAPLTETPCRILLWKTTKDQNIPIPAKHRPDLLIHTAIPENTTALKDKDTHFSYTPSDSPDTLQDQLHLIDQAHRAPIEVIILTEKNSALIQASNKLGIPTHILPPKNI